VKETDFDSDIRQQIQKMMDQGLATIDVYKRTCEILFFNTVSCQPPQNSMD